MRFDFQITTREEIRLKNQVVQQLTDRNIKLMFDVYSMINFIDSWTFYMLLLFLTEYRILELKNK